MQHCKLPVLATGRVRLHNNRGMIIFARILFDTGSEADLINEKCANRANLPRQKYSIEIEGVTGNEIIDLGLVNAKRAFEMFHSRQDL